MSGAPSWTGGLDIAPAERRGHPHATRIVPKKAGYDVRPSGQKAPKDVIGGAAWLAKMRRAVAQKEIFDPTEADIEEMRTAIGDDGAFADLSDANKALLFSVMLTLRRNSKSTASSSNSNRSGPARSSKRSWLSLQMRQLSRRPRQGRGRDERGEKGSRSPRRGGR